MVVVKALESSGGPRTSAVESETCVEYRRLSHPQEGKPNRTGISCVSFPDGFLRSIQTSGGVHSPPPRKTRVKSGLEKRTRRRRFPLPVTHPRSPRSGASTTRTRSPVVLCRKGPCAAPEPETTRNASISQSEIGAAAISAESGHIQDARQQDDRGSFSQSEAAEQVPRKQGGIGLGNASGIATRKSMSREKTLPPLFLQFLCNDLFLVSPDVKRVPKRDFEEE